MIAKWYAASSVVPVLVLLLSGIVLPKGTDPRGFGPPLVGVLVSFGLSIVLGVVGVALVAFYRKSPNQMRWSVVGTLLALTPVTLLTIAYAMGRA
jgi:hypothetical protein